MTRGSLLLALGTDDQRLAHLRGRRREPVVLDRFDVDVLHDLRGRSRGTRRSHCAGRADDRVDSLVVLEVPREVVEDEVLCPDRHVAEPGVMDRLEQPEVPVAG